MSPAARSSARPVGRERPVSTKCSDSRCFGDELADRTPVGEVHVVEQNADAERPATGQFAVQPLDRSNGRLRGTSTPATAAMRRTSELAPRSSAEHSTTRSVPRGAQRVLSDCFRHGDGLAEPGTSDDEHGPVLPTTVELAHEARAGDEVTGQSENPSRLRDAGRRREIRAASSQGASVAQRITPASERRCRRRVGDEGSGYA